MLSYDDFLLSNKIGLSKIIAIMRINKIDIINFRGFQHETREFKSNLTVVIGNNTQVRLLYSRLYR